MLAEFYVSISCISFKQKVKIFLLVPIKLRYYKKYVKLVDKTFRMLLVIN